MATSAIPAFKAALKQRLEQRAGLARVQVSYGPPLPMPEVEFVWLDKVQARQRAAGMRGIPGIREEEFELDLVIRVTRSALDEQQGTSDRAFELLAEIENELRNDPTVNATVRVAEIAGYELTEWQDAEKQYAALTVTVSANQRI